MAAVKNSSPRARLYDRLKCPVCKDPFIPFKSNGVRRNTCSRQCGQTLRRAPDKYSLDPIPAEPGYRHSQSNSKPKPRKKSRVREIILDMPKEDRVDYEVEGCMPLLETPAPFGWVDEDTDATPVPAGCPQCYLTGTNNECCGSCPSPVSVKEIRRIRKALA